MKKVTLVYKDLEGRIAEEHIWTEKIPEGYRVDNIPFFAANLAIGDVIGVEDDDGHLYFDDLIHPSGHSTVQMVFFNRDKELETAVMKTLEILGCKWESMKNASYYAIDIPTDTDYRKVRKYLSEESAKGILDFKEACLSACHRAGIAD